MSDHPDALPMSAVRWLMAVLLAANLLTAYAGPSDRAVVLEGAWLVNGVLMPRQQNVPDSRQPIARPGLAVVLGGGGMRGYAHIGVLQALEEAGIRPDLIVGTSIGAIVGAAYASGTRANLLWQQASSMRVRSLADVTFSGPGFVKGAALSNWVNDMVKQQPIEHFLIPFAAVATDIDRSLPYVITRGNAGEAARASAAIPGVFLPVQSSGQVLLEGDVTSLLPVSAARALGAHVVVAVDIYCHGPKYPSSSVATMWLKVSQTQTCLLSSTEAASADVLIAPAIAAAGVDDAVGRETARNRGYQATLTALPALQEALARSRQRGDQSIRAQ